MRTPRQGPHRTVLDVCAYDLSQGLSGRCMGMNVRVLGQTEGGVVHAA